MKLDVETDKEDDEPNATPAPAPATYVGASRKIPPVVVDETEKWKEVLVKMKEANIRFNQARTIKGASFSNIG